MVFAVGPGLAFLDSKGFVLHLIDLIERLDFLAAFAVDFVLAAGSVVADCFDPAAVFVADNNSVLVVVSIDTVVDLPALPPETIPQR